MNWYLGVLKKYIDFNGRARRKEYWYFVLFNVLFTLILLTIDRATNNGGGFNLGILSGVYILATLVPSIAVGVRRLHDTGRNAWWMLLALIPFGSLVLIVFFVLNSQPGDNEYGPNPKEDSDVMSR